MRRNWVEVERGSEPESVGRVGGCSQSGHPGRLGRPWGWAVGMFGALLLATLVTSSATAWSEAGHEVVAAIAWEAMSPAVRERAVELLRDSPADSGIAGLAAPGRDRQLFVVAATWADRIKRNGSRYNRSSWHYTNHFWRLDAAGQPVAVDHLRPKRENVVERTEHLAAVLADDRLRAGERAVALAWLLHLVGDLHQPLHTSARVTDHPGEERGDRGGNEVLLHRDRWSSEHRWNLHSYWDRIFDEARSPRFWESRNSWVERLAEEATAAWPGDRLAKLGEGDPEAWAAEGLGLAQTVVYPGVERFQAPSASYRAQALTTSHRAVALAGYRLADLLESTLSHR